MTPSPDSTATPHSLRDLFAGQMASALIVAPKQPGVSRPDLVELARMAYEYADALLKAREA